MRVMCFDFFKDINRDYDRLELIEKVKFLEKYAKAFPDNLTIFDRVPNLV